MTQRTSRTLTAAWLEQQGACEDRLCLAILHFGAEAPLTRTTLREAAALGLPLPWLAQCLLTSDQWAAYRAQMDAYYAVTKQYEIVPLRAAHLARVADLLADTLGLP
jgi:hypothetical protein